MVLEALDIEERKRTPPFLLKLFYRTGAFHRADEFSSSALPPCLDMYTWKTSTFTELTHHLANHRPSLLPSPAIGTRLAFRLIFPDANTPARFVVKDLGSIVLGAGGPGVSGDEPSATPDQGREDSSAVDGWGGSGFAAVAAPAEPNVASRTLGDVKFVAGDYISCAILPPLDDGSVAPETSARSGRGSGAGEARPWDDGPGLRSRPGAQRLAGWGGGRQGAEAYLGRGGSGTMPGQRGGPRPPGFESGGIPAGEWRRGERLPDGPGGGGRGGGRGRVRGPRAGTKW